MRGEIRSSKVKNGGCEVGKLVRASINFIKNQCTAV